MIRVYLLGDTMEKTSRFRIVTINGERSIVVDENRRLRIKKFRGILGKADEKTVSWAIKEAEEL